MEINSNWFSRKCCMYWVFFFLPGCGGTSSPPRNEVTFFSVRESLYINRLILSGLHPGRVYNIKTPDV